MGTRTLGRFRLLSQQMLLGSPEIDCDKSRIAVIWVTYHHPLGRVALLMQAVPSKQLLVACCKIEKKKERTTQMQQNLAHGETEHSCVQGKPR